MVRASASQSVDLGLISQVESSANRNSVENKLTSLLAVSLCKALNGMPPSLCGRQVVGPSSLPIVVAPVQLKTCKPSVSAYKVETIYTSSCIMLTTNSSNDEEEEADCQKTAGPVHNLSYYIIMRLIIVVRAG